MIPTQEAPASVDIRLESFPEFAGNGTKTPPTDAKRALGYVPSDTFPAEQANWLFNKSSKGVSRGNMGILSIEKELNLLIACAGCSPDITCNNQVFNAIMYQINSCFSERAPSMHASSDVSYGVGNADCYGHVKLSDEFNCILSSCSGVAASQKALATVFSCLQACGGAPLSNMPPSALGPTSDVGTATTAARSDHVHPYPNQLDVSNPIYDSLCCKKAGCSCFLPAAAYYYISDTYSSTSDCVKCLFDCDLVRADVGSLRSFSLTNSKTSTSLSAITIRNCSSFPFTVIGCSVTCGHASGTCCIITCCSSIGPTLLNPGSLACLRMNTYGCGYITMRVCTGVVEYIKYKTNTTNLPTGVACQEFGIMSYFS